jgi:hypothetical protein
VTRAARDVQHAIDATHRLAFQQDAAGDIERRPSRRLVVRSRPIPTLALHPKL